jgi:cysteine desulfurase
VHTDAVQAAPWCDLTAIWPSVDALSLSAHKIGGPKGVGALVVRRSVELEPLVLGGGQERERRSGTHNVAGIVGFALALAAAAREREATVTRVARLRDRLVDGLRAAVPDLVETVPPSHKVAGNAHVCIPGVESEALLFLVDREGVCASAASSCASGALSGSHVLAAMGLDPALAVGALRLTLGATTTDGDVDHALAVIPAAVARLRERSRR